MKSILTILNRLGTILFNIILTGVSTFSSVKNNQHHLGD